MLCSHLPRCLPLAALALALAACVPFDDADPADCAGKCDQAGADGGAGECLDPRYRDGTCDLDIDCAAPDLDCLVTFEDDAAATEWYAVFEELLAREGFREPRALLSSSDPRYARMRELLDRGWASYREHFPVGELASFRPALVLVEDPAVNAFVAPDANLEQVGFAVMVQTGLLDLGGTDAELLGLVMHELHHAVELHTLPGRKKLFHVYYQVQPGQPEPFGFEQENDPVAQAALEGVLTAAADVGVYAYDELNGVPLAGLFAQTRQLAQQAGVERDPEACADAGAAGQLLTEFIGQHLRTLDGTLVLGDDGADLDYITSEYMAALRNPCLADSTASILEFWAFQLQKSVDQVRAETAPEDLALVEGKHVVDALGAITAARFDSIAAVDDMLATQTGAGIESLRYFTSEEAADDATVAVLRGAGVDPTGLAAFLPEALLSPADAAACQDILDSGEMPHYGANLLDDHHSTCWRAWHIRQLASRDAAGSAARAVSRRTPQPELERALRELAVEPLPRRERLSDYIPDCFASPAR